ncbi:uncharacterized protein [Aegilops tauschii subsp. strangulata]|uniref:uncharacterized protein n=1 Tax=Aegilops tauschii subsp. strangulata TaxID=200361 RepID=UPI001ABD0400|nr:uncharacterized protein LOC109748916 [Aegilops tauschii subsp. strangulata]
MSCGAHTAPHSWLFISSPAVQLPPPSGHPRCRVSVRATCAPTSSRVPAGGGNTRHQTRPRLVAAHSVPPPPPPTARTVRRDAATGLAFLLFVLALALQQMEIAARKLLKLAGQEVPGTISSLKLSFMEINDLTSQLKKIRHIFTTNRSGKDR